MVDYKNKQVKSSAGGLFKGEHHDTNNPDCKITFEKPSYEEINDMARAKGRGYPITSKYDVESPGNEKQQMFTAGDGSGRLISGEESAPTPNVAWTKKVRMLGQEEALQEP
jgi:hypothetical protein